MELHSCSWAFDYNLSPTNGKKQSLKIHFKLKVENTRSFEKTTLSVKKLTSFLPTGQRQRKNLLSVQHVQNICNFIPLYKWMNWSKFSRTLGLIIRTLTWNKNNNCKLKYVIILQYNQLHSSSPNPLICEC